MAAGRAQAGAGGRRRAASALKAASAAPRRCRRCQIRARLGSARLALAPSSAPRTLSAPDLGPRTPPGFGLWHAASLEDLGPETASERFAHLLLARVKLSKPDTSARSCRDANPVSQTRRGTAPAVVRRLSPSLDPRTRISDPGREAESTHPTPSRPDSTSPRMRPRTARAWTRRRAGPWALAGLCPSPVE